MKWKLNRHIRGWGGGRGGLIRWPSCVHTTSSASSFQIAQLHNDDGAQRARTRPLARNTRKRKIYCKQSFLRMLHFLIAARSLGRHQQRVKLRQDQQSSTNIIIHCCCSSNSAAIILIIIWWFYLVWHPHSDLYPNLHPAAVWVGGVNLNGLSLGSVAYFPRSRSLRRRLFRCLPFEFAVDFWVS